MQRFLSLLCIVLSLIAVASNYVNAQEFRFASGQSGLVLAQTSSGASWGTICRSGGTYSFDYTSASALCRIMGWETLTSYLYTYTTTSGYSHKMSMHCASTSYIYPSSCSRSYSSTCSSSSTYAVGVYCYGLRTGHYQGIYSGSYYIRLSKYLRRLEVRLPHASASSSLTWGSTCDDSFSTTTANRICSWFGFSTSGNNFFTAGGGSNTIRMDNLYCSSSATSLSSCAYGTFHNCNHSEDVGMMCKTTGTYPTGGYYLSGQYLLYRQSSGLVLAKRLLSTSYSTLGYVCDDAMMNSVTAGVLYRITNGGVACSSTVSYTGSSSSSGIFVMNNLQCSSSSYRSLAQCSFSTSHNNCVASEQLKLTCGSSSSPSSSSSSTGIIAGAVVGSIVGLIICGVIIAALVGSTAMSNKKSATITSTTSVTPAATTVNAPSNTTAGDNWNNTGNNNNSIEMGNTMMQPQPVPVAQPGYMAPPPPDSNKKIIMTAQPVSKILSIPSSSPYGSPLFMKKEDQQQQQQQSRLQPKTPIQVMVASSSVGDDGDEKTIPAASSSSSTVVKEEKSLEVSKDDLNAALRAASLCVAVVRGEADRDEVVSVLDQEQQKQADDENAKNTFESSVLAGEVEKWSSTLKNIPTENLADLHDNTTSNFWSVSETVMESLSSAPAPIGSIASLVGAMFGAVQKAKVNQYECQMLAMRTSRLLPIFIRAASENITAAGALYSESRASLVMCMKLVQKFVPPSIENENEKGEEVWIGERLWNFIKSEVNTTFSTGPEDFAECHTRLDRIIAEVSLAAQLDVHRDVHDTSRKLEEIKQSCEMEMQQTISALKTSLEEALKKSTAETRAEIQASQKEITTMFSKMEKKLDSFVSIVKSLTREKEFSDLEIDPSRIEVLPDYCLGVGGQGAVYLCRFDRTMYVAAKTTTASSKDEARRILREAKLMTKLKSPGITQCYGIAITQFSTEASAVPRTRVVLLMERCFCSVADLAEKIHLSFSMVLYFFGSLCSGLSELSNLGLVHRDIKPQNMLLASRGSGGVVTKFHDFGSTAKQASLHRLYVETSATAATAAQHHVGASGTTVAASTTTTASADITTTTAAPPAPTNPVIKLTLFANNTKSKQEILTLLASMLGIPSSSLAIVSDSSTGSTVLKIEIKGETGASGNATAALKKAMDLTPSQLSLLGASEIQDDTSTSAPAAAELPIPLIAGCAAGGLLLLIIILVVIKKNSEGEARYVDDTGRAGTFGSSPMLNIPTSQQGVGAQFSSNTVL